MNLLLLKQTGLRQTDGWVYCEHSTRLIMNYWGFFRQPSDSYLELLLHILDDGLAVEADERRADQLGVDRVGSDDLTGDLEECADAGRLQVSHFVLGADFHKADVQFLLHIKIGLVLHIRIYSLAKVRINSEKQK